MSVIQSGLTLPVRGAPVRRRALVEVVPDSELPFDFIEAKILVPPVRAGMLPRTPLVNRLRGSAGASLVAVVAPAGYGKTTLLAQWAARDDRPFAWVSIDERDDDPVILLRHVAASLDRVFPLDPRVLSALRSPKSIWRTAMPRLASALSKPRSPFVLVLDDAHLLQSHDSVEAVRVLAEQMLPGSALVTAGRMPPRLPFARFRSRGRLFELGTDELALSGREARLLLQGAGVELGDAEADELIRRTEGWAAGLYLAGLALQDAGRLQTTAESFGGDDRFLADYLHTEYLSKLGPKRLSFLRQTSHLGRLSGPLCDAVLGRTGSARELAAIEKSNLFLVPLDRHGEWYRYHHLFRDLLQRELEEHEPELVCDLNRRAADWFEANGDPEAALGHAHAAGDTDRVARILASIAIATYDAGRVATVEGWLARFDDDELLARYPAVAAHGSRVHLLRGRTDEAERWLGAAERGARKRGADKPPAGVTEWINVLRAAMCADGAEQMLADAGRAVAKLALTSQWRPAALLLQGVALFLLGDVERADAALAEAENTAQKLGSTETWLVAIAERALIAAARGDNAGVEELSAHARAAAAEAQPGECATNALQLAVSARVLLRTGHWQEARACLTSARRVLPLLTNGLPWLAVQARLELAYAYVAMRERDQAQAMLAEIHAILARRPGLGTLAAQAAELEQELALTVEPGVEDVEAHRCRASRAPAPGDAPFLP